MTLSLQWQEDLYSELVIELYILLGFKFYEQPATPHYSLKSYGVCKDLYLETHHKQSSSQWGL